MKMNPRFAQAPTPRSGSRFHPLAPILCLVLGVVLMARQSTAALDYTTISGRPGQPGFDDGPPRSAKYAYPNWMAMDARGNIYLADSINYVIRRISPDGKVRTIAGPDPVEDIIEEPDHPQGDGHSSEARFGYPAGLAINHWGRIIVADLYRHTIREVTPEGRVVTLAGRSGAHGHQDGIGTGARFRSPAGIAADATGNVIVTELDGHTIRKVTPAGVVSTIAGRPGVRGFANGYGAEALFNEPMGIVIDRHGSIFVADTGNNLIRKVAPDGKVTTYAGTVGDIGHADGRRHTAHFGHPTGLVLDAQGNLFVTDTATHVIRMITPDGMVSTVGGMAREAGWVDGPGLSSRFNEPTGLALDVDGSLIIADAGNAVIRRGAVPPSVPPVLRLLAVGEAEGARLTIQGAPRARVTIEFREALNDASGWQLLGTALLDNGTATLTDPDPVGLRRFYRVRQ